MEQVETATQQSDNSQAAQVSQANTDQATQTAAQLNSTLDAATLAADTIAKASGLESLEQVAAMVAALDSRIKPLEAALPEALQLLSDVKALVPAGFVSRVEGFFTSHFPHFGATATTSATQAE
jgi:hypothetical protein